MHWVSAAARREASRRGRAAWFGAWSHPANSTWHPGRYGGVLQRACPLSDFCPERESIDPMPLNGRGDPLSPDADYQSAVWWLGEDSDLG